MVPELFRLIKLLLHMHKPPDEGVRGADTVLTNYFKHIIGMTYDIGTCCSSVATKQVEVR